MRSRIWHGVLALVILASLVTQIVMLLAGGPDVNAGAAQAQPSTLTRLIRLFSYFTIQSNLLLLAGAAALAWRPDRDGPLWRVLRLDGLLGIVVTGIVFATVLAAVVHPDGALAWATNFGFHYFAPWWALAGWLIFGPRPRIDRRTLARAVLWPVLWIGWTVAHGAVTGWFPYPFTDAGELGYPAAIRNMLFVVLLAAVIAAGLWLLDRRLPCLGVRRDPPVPPGVPVTGSGRTGPAGRRSGR